MSVQETRVEGARPRSAALDAVRIVGILAVVAGHVWALPALHTWLYPWHVPVFFLLTGYLWRERSVAEELRARWASLGRPYVLWLAVVLVCAVVATARAGRLTSDTVLVPLLAAQASRPFTTFWFVGALFASAVLYRVVRVAARGRGWTEPVALVLALLATLLAGPLLARTPLSAGSALPCLLFLAAGRMLARVPVRWPVLVGAALLALSAAGLATGVVQPVDLKQGNWGTPVLSVIVSIAISWGLVLLAERAFQLLPPAVHRVVIGLATTGLVVVLLHSAVLAVLPVHVGIGPFVLAVVGPGALALLLLRTPLAGWTTGVRRVRAAVGAPR